MHYRHVEFRHRGNVDGGVTLGKVVHQHAAALEAQLTVVALEDELLVVRRGDLRHESRLTGAGLGRMST